MPRRHPLPRLWLMTDERMGDMVAAAVRRLPRGSGVVFRHYATPAAERRRLYEEVRRIARSRRLTLILAGPPAKAIAWKADGAHSREPGRFPGRQRLRTAPAHDACEIRAAERAGADLLFLSPVFATRSHAGARALGRRRFAKLARMTRLPVIALGGMNRRRACTLTMAHGWAAIDSLMLNGAPWHPATD